MALISLVCMQLKTEDAYLGRNFNNSYCVCFQILVHFFFFFFFLFFYLFTIQTLTLLMLLTMPFHSYINNNTNKINNTSNTYTYNTNTKYFLLFAKRKRKKKPSLLLSVSNLDSKFEKTLMNYTWFIYSFAPCFFFFIFIFFLRALGSSCQETKRTTTEAPTFLKQLYLYFFSI